LRGNGCLQCFSEPGAGIPQRTRNYTKEGRVQLGIAIASESNLS
jgi:hypothetical protein